MCEREEGRRVAFSRRCREMKRRNVFMYKRPAKLIENKKMTYIQDGSVTLNQILDILRGRLLSILLPGRLWHGPLATPKCRSSRYLIGCNLDRAATAAHASSSLLSNSRCAHGRRSPPCTYLQIIIKLALISAGSYIVARTTHRLFFCSPGSLYLSADRTR